MKLLSLFSGIGAFEKALDRIGIPYELVGYCEIDKYASKSYSAIHGVSEEMNLGDITKIDGQALPKDIDLITYGFPCQDISLAGKQKGLFNEDGSQTRSGLFFEALRLIEDTQPKVAIAENVKNLTGKTFKPQFEIVLKSLEEAGYNNYWKVLNAKDYGVPQNRERVFIVSIRKDIDTGKFTFPEGFPLTSRLKDVLEPEVDEKYYLTGTKDFFIKNSFDMEAKGNGFRFEPHVRNNADVAKTITTRAGGRMDDNFVIDIESDRTTFKFDSTNPIFMVKEASELQKEVCKKDIEKELVTPYDIIDYTYSNARLNEIMNGTIKTKNSGNNQIANTLTCNVENFGVCVPEATKKGYAEAYEGDSINLEQPNSQTRRGRVGHGVAQTLTTQPQQAVVVPIGNSPKHNNKITEFELSDKMKKYINSYNDKYKVGDGNLVINREVACTITTREGTARADSCNYISTEMPENQNVAGVDLVPYQIRKLTPRECFRLMDFDDDDFDACVNVGISNAQLYKQAGNSIVVAVPYYIIRSLIEAGVFEYEPPYEVIVNGKLFFSEKQAVEYFDNKGTKEEIVEEKTESSYNKQTEYIFDQNKLIDLLLREGIISIKN